jgi:aryl-alcohol dehydrogenase-like predicted oxidoreductase
MRALEAAIDQGVNFFDTADVYGDGRSEKLLGKLAKSKKDKIYIATKAGRRLNPHVAEGYTIQNIRRFVERSLDNLQVDCLDLLQLHCPPTEVYENEALFDGLVKMKQEGLVAHFGVSVEKVDEALRAMQYEDVATVQIIYNMFRLKPGEVFLPQALKNNVGVIARVPLASGLLTGKMSENTQFDKDDHRSFNRNGEAFDKGETFSGVDYNTALEAVDKLKEILPAGMTMAQFALKWILTNPGVSCVIPGGKTPEQVNQNTAASDFGALSKEAMNEVEKIYDQYVKKLVHHLW